MNTYFEQEHHTPLTPAPSWAERNGFTDWAVAMIWVVVGFICFQLTAGIVAVALISITAGPDLGPDILSLMTEHLDLVFIGNTTGQILFIGLASWFVARLHVPAKERLSFLRLRILPNTGRMLALTALLFVVVQPVIWWLGYLNSLVPLPDSVIEMQQAQHEMIESFLRGDNIMYLALFHIALIPAICEELLFRGYLLRAFQRSWGAWTAILASGLIFGLYHLQIANLLPLATLGILLALVSWLSGSLLPAILAHFINNGGSVLMASYYPDLAFAELTLETAPPVWVLLLSIVATAGVLRLLFNNRNPES